MKITISRARAPRVACTAKDLLNPHVTEAGMYRIAFTTDAHRDDRFVVLGAAPESRVVIYIPRVPDEAPVGRYVTGFAPDVWPGSQFIACDPGEVVQLTFTQE